MSPAKAGMDEERRTPVIVRETTRAFWAVITVIPVCFAIVTYWSIRALDTLDRVAPYIAQSEANKAARDKEVADLKLRNDAQDQRNDLRNDGQDQRLDDHQRRLSSVEPKVDRLVSDFASTTARLDRLTDRPTPGRH